MTKDLNMSAIDDQSLFSDEELFDKGKNKLFIFNKYIKYILIVIKLSIFVFSFIDKNQLLLDLISKLLSCKY